MTDKTCETCQYNDSGLCDRTGRFVDDKDTCSKHTPDWRDAVLRTYLDRKLGE